MGGRKGFTSVTMTGRLQRTGVLQSSVMLIVMVTVADVEKKISNKWFVLTRGPWRVRMIGGLR